MTIDWAKVVRKHGHVVWQTAYRLLADHEDAADAFQETFVSALQITQHGRVRDWSGLLRSLATRRALDQLRRRYRLAGRSDREADLSQLPSANPGPAQQAAASELRERLREAMTLLTPQQAEAFCLRHLEHMSYRQIARQLGLTVNSVSALLHRARMHLRESMREDLASMQKGEQE